MSNETPYILVYGKEQSYVGKAKTKAEADKLIRANDKFMQGLGYKDKTHSVQAKNVNEARQILSNKGKKDFIVRGTQYEDRLKMRGLGLRWDRENKAWRGKLSSEGAKEVGRKFNVTQDKQAFTEKQRLAQYKKKQSEKAVDYRQRARKLERQASGELDDVRKQRDSIPFGQPILVGHHSEGSHRNFLNRMNRKEDKAIEKLRKADEYQGRANTLERRSGQPKGTAEAKRQAKREVADKTIGKGTKIKHPVYGEGTVTRVNKKTFTAQFSKGFKTTIDKSWVKKVK